MGMVVISNSFVSGSVDCKLTSAGRSDAETPSSLVKSTFDKKRLCLKLISPSIQNFNGRVDNTAVP